MLENREKSWFRKTDAYITAFLVPVIILVIIYAQRGIYPFGDKIYLRMDMYHQYAPFLSEFRDKLISGKSFLYSWNIGMGVNFIPVISYYLASPFNWLIAFVPRQHILEFMDYGIVFKTGLAGLAMAVYLHRHSENSHMAPAFLGIFYALSGYMAAYSWNVMWLDCIILFPIICIGIEKIVYEKKGLLYAAALGICIVSNYYISIMVCIFAVMYFIMMLVLKGRQGFGSFAATIGIFAGFSLLAGGVAAVLWMPQIYEYSMTASANNDFPTVVQSYFSAIDVIARHMINVKVETDLNHWPNIYCGVAVVPLIIMYITNRQISLKEKCIYVFAAFFFIASFSLNILAYLWHGLHFPNSLPSRQSFIYIFIVLFMCFRTIDNLDGNKLKDIAVAAVGSAAFIILCQKFEESLISDWKVWYLSLGFIAIYLLILYLYRLGKMNVNAVTFILLAVVSIEAAVNMTGTGISITNRDQYIRDNDNVRAVVAFVEDDKDFYRFEKNSRKSKDDGAWLNFHSVSLFASTAHADMTELFGKLGCESSTNAYSIVGSTPLVDALFDVKYAIYNGTSENPYQHIMCRSGETELYRNKYCLPLGYMLPSDIEKLWPLDAGDPVIVQNQLAKVFGTDNVLKQVDGFREGGIYSFTVPEDGLYYAFSDNKKTEKIEVTRGDSKTVFDNADRGYLIELGWLHKNEIIDLKPLDGTEVLCHAYRFNYEALAEITERLSVGQATITGYNSTHVNALVEVPDGNAGMMLMTIPYDPGWRVCVDGSPVKTYKGLNAFIGFDLGSGHHEISMDFYPQGFKNGFMISAVCLAILIILAIIFLIIFIVRKNKAGKKEEPVAQNDDPVGYVTAQTTEGETAANEDPEQKTEEPEEDESKTEAVKEYDPQVDTVEANPEIHEWVVRSVLESEAEEKAETGESRSRRRQRNR